MKTLPSYRCARCGGTWRGDQAECPACGELEARRVDPPIELPLTEVVTEKERDS